MRPLEWPAILAECGATPIPYERWRTVKGFERFYAVSNHGRVLSFPARRVNGSGFTGRLAPRLMSSSTVNRPKVHLYGDMDKHRDVKVYVLVAEHFVLNLDGHKLVCHKDDNSQNNHWRNLYWGTYAQNSDDRSRNGGAAKKLTLELVQQIKRELAVAQRTASGRFAPGGLARIADRHGVSTMTVHKINIGKDWKHAQST